MTAWEEVPFDGASAWALYGSPDEYLRRFENALDATIQARWYLPGDRAAILHAATDLANRVFARPHPL